MSLRFVVAALALASCASDPPARAPVAETSREPPNDAPACRRGAPDPKAIATTLAALIRRPRDLDGKRVRIEASIAADKGALTLVDELPEPGHPSDVPVIDSSPRIALGAGAPPACASRRVIVEGVVRATGAPHSPGIAATIDPVSFVEETD